MKKLFVLLTLCVLIAGCGPLSTDDDYILAATKSIKFAKHYEAGICFAFFKNGNNNYVSIFTHVPCTPEVEALLINKREKPCENQCPKNAPLLPEKMEQK